MCIDMRMARVQTCPMTTTASIKAIDLAIGDVVIPRLVDGNDLVVVGKRAALTFEMRDYAEGEHGDELYSITYYGDEYVTVVR